MIPRFSPQVGWPEFSALLRRHPSDVSRFEADFARHFGVRDAVAFPYGRVAQEVFLESVGLKGATIALPAYTCSVVAHAVTLSGNSPRFVDINRHDFNMSLDLLAADLDPSVRAVIATNTFGYPQDVEGLETIVAEASERYGHRVYLVQDLAHAFGAEWKGKPVVASGDVAVFGLNISKMLTSIFGGMLTFQDQAMADRVRETRDRVLSRSTLGQAIRHRAYLAAAATAHLESLYRATRWLQSQTGLLDRWTKAYHRDNEIHFPPDARQRMSPVAAAVGRRQLNKYEQIVTRRRENAVLYDRLLRLPSDWVKPPMVEGATYSHYTVRVPDRAAARRLWARRGFDLGELIQYSLPDLPEYADVRSMPCPNAAEASRVTVNFPLTLTPSRLQDILERL